MRTVLELPDDLAAEVQRRAAQDGRAVEAEVVELVRKGLEIAGHELSLQGEAQITTDPATGLPVIHSPADAPVHRMTAARLQQLVERTLLEEDLERAGIPVRR